MAKKLGGLFTIYKCADFREFYVQMFLHTRMHFQNCVRVRVCVRPWVIKCKCIVVH